MKLSGLRGQWVVLFFYPRDFTFGCPTEIRAFARLHTAFQSERAVVIGASTDSYYAHKAWFESDPRLLDVSYPVIADTSQQLSNAFGVLLDDGTALRGTFIIDPEGIVRCIHVNDLDVGRKVDESLRLLRALRTGELCPESWQAGRRAKCSLWDPGADENHLRSLRAYQSEIESLLARGRLPGAIVAKLVLDRPGGLRFKRENPWLADVNFLPYTVLYRDGQQVDAFAASKASYLIERLAGRSPQLR